MAQFNNLDLLLKEIKDPYVQENFYKLKLYLERLARNKTGNTTILQNITGGGGSGNTILSGSGAPLNTLGNNGDFYIDTLNYDIYGPKASGAWGVGVSLIGADGAAGPIGPMGPPGPSAGALVTANAAITISAIRAVKLDSSGEVIYSTNDQTYADAQTIGITLTAASVGDPVDILTFGEVADPSITFSIDSDIFLGLNGALTDVAPITGMYLRLGKIIKTQTLFIDIEQTIIL